MSFSRVIFFFLVLFSLCCTAQVFTDSNLPIIIITTDSSPITGQPLPILDDPRVLGTMKIIKRPDGTRNYLTDINTASFLNYNGRINIEIRGSSSQFLPKKGYGFSTLLSNNISNNNVSLLSMPSENDWILNPLAFDPSLIRDYLSYNLARQMGNYATRTAYCEVIVNGEYVGLYLLQEKIKQDSNRVDIIEITPTDNTLPALSGGYITKADKETGGDPVAWVMPSYAYQTNFIHDLPKPEEVTPQQNSYIYGRFNSLAITSNTNNTNITSGYPSVIDIPSFVDFMISNELASNADGYQLSTFFHKDRNAKLRAGPIWDFNLTYGNDLFLWGFDRSKVDVWQFSDGGNEGAKFWRDLFNSSTFKCYLSKRWNALIQPGKPLNYISLSSFIDATITLISEAKIREHQKWETIPNLTLEITNLKTFLSQRILWINNHIGPYTACNSVATPSLVITKINYNPGISTSFPVSNDQEFIEIKNAGTTTVNLSGYYFKGTGFTFSFPTNATILANQSIYLASNPATFLSKYGLTAFGQFTRNLSNSSQKIELADAFGNTIDFVEYFDSSPWPNADGNGSYLKLISTSLDNNIASSWIASNTVSLGEPEIENSSNLIIYPNPTATSINIKSALTINSVKIYSIYGALVYSNQTIDSKEISIDCSGYSSGYYTIMIQDQESVHTKLIGKK